jgi:hypothetical protein
LPVETCGLRVACPCEGLVGEANLLSYDPALVVAVVGDLYRLTFVVAYVIPPFLAGLFVDLSFDEAAGLAGD